MRTTKGLFVLAAAAAVIAIMASCNNSASPDNGVPCTQHVWGDWERVGEWPVLQTSRICTVYGCNEQQFFNGGAQRQASPIPGLPVGMLAKEMVRIPAGSIMGITQNQDFWMSRHQVTRAQWEAVMGTTPWGGTPADNRAVTHVSWLDAMEFANRLSRDRGLTLVYSIPAEIGGAMTTDPDL